MSIESKPEKINSSLTPYCKGLSQRLVQQEKNKWRTKHRLLKMWITTKVHAVCVLKKFALKIKLSAGNRYNTPKGRKFIESLNCKTGRYLLMNRAYEEKR